MLSTTANLAKFYSGTYSSNHWALQNYELNDPKVIAHAYYKDCQYAVYTNPTDKRGYRSIVRYIKNDDMQSTINRPFSSTEKIGLGLVVQLVSDAYSKIVPIVQSAVAGNNSHQFNPEQACVYIGTANEPSFLHGHVYGRGDPEKCYIEGVKLDGPAPGANFDMMARTYTSVGALEPGNDKKVAWKEGEMAQVVAIIKEKINELQGEYAETGLSIVLS